MQPAMPSITVTALYRFAPLPHFRELRQPLLALCNAARLKGTLLLADEGINGTVAGDAEGIAALHHWLDARPEFSGFEHKESFAARNPFARMKVRLKKEIVALGLPGIDAARDGGTRVAPEQWNALIADPATILIDTRNDYEVAIGTFAGALNPNTVNFRDFPAWFRASRDKVGHKPKIAMFCTGGIRCEKASAFVRAEGFEDVFQLSGGILKYLEDVPAGESRWQGECFVFDDRVSVDHALKPGSYDLCHACRMPLSQADKASPRYVAGVSCPRCHETVSAEKKQRFAERQRQVQLARSRGEKHVAADLEAARRAKHQRLQRSRNAS